MKYEMYCICFILSVSSLMLPTMQYLPYICAKMMISLCLEQQILSMRTLGNVLGCT